MDYGRGGVGGIADGRVEIKVFGKIEVFQA